MSDALQAVRLALQIAAEPSPNVTYSKALLDALNHGGFIYGPEVRTPPAEAAAKEDEEGRSAIDALHKLGYVRNPLGSWQSDYLGIAVSGDGVARCFSSPPRSNQDKIEFWRNGEGYSLDPQEALAACVTLINLNYTYHGGEQWKPPIGNVPGAISNATEQSLDYIFPLDDVPPVVLRSALLALQRTAYDDGYMPKYLRMFFGLLAIRQEKTEPRS